MPTPADIPMEVLQGVARGRYSVLLGAGFSASSAGPHGTPLPIGDQLAQRLSAAFKLPSKYGLAQLADAIPDDELSRYLVENFSQCRASDGAAQISSFVWRTLYTFNVDDVLLDCYQRKDALQKVTAVTFRQPYQRPEDPGDVFAVHLHGSVHRPQDGFVFSTRHYGQSSALDSTWFTVLSDEFTHVPFIIVGCTLAEPDLEYYLERRSGLAPDTKQILPSLFVTRHGDAVLEARCRRFGLTLVESDSDSFFRALADRTHPRPTPLDLVIPRHHQRFARLPTEQHQRVFYRQWLDSANPDLPKLPSAPPSLLRGTEPHWEHITGNEDVIRRTTKELVDEIAAWAAKGTHNSATRLLFSSSGEGRTTILMRVFWEASQLKLAAFYHIGHERLADEAAIDVLSAMKVPVVIFVDSAAEWSYPAARLRKALHDSNVRYFMVLAERTYRRDIVKSAFGDIDYSEVGTKPLLLGEATALVARMRSEGLLAREARRSDDELARRIVRKDNDLFSAILSLWSGSKKVSGVAASELSDIEDPMARKIYVLIAVAHRCGYPLRTSLLSRASGVNASRVASLVYATLKGIVLPLPPMGEYVQTRHRRLAEELVRSLPTNERFEAFFSLASVLSNYVNRDTIRAQTHEARLAGRLLDLDETVKPLLGPRTEEFYLGIKERWEWNSRYWEQRALLELDRDPHLALTYAQHAVGIERHPLPLTTLAKVQFEVAGRKTDPADRLQAVVECLSTVHEAMNVRRRLQFREIQPLDVGIRGCLDYLSYLRSRKTYELDVRVKSQLRDLMNDAKRVYAKDEYVVLRTRYDELIQAFR